jgi:hypothetical protein
VVLSFFLLLSSFSFSSLTTASTNYNQSSNS